MFLKKFLIPVFFLLFCAHLPAQYSLAEITGSVSSPSVIEHESPQEIEKEDQSPPLMNQTVFEDNDAPAEFSYWRQFFKMMSVLGVILAVVLSIVWTLRGYLNRRVQQINQNHLIKILEKRTLSPKSMLVLVEVGDQQILVSDSQNGGVQLISQLPSQNKLTRPNEESLKTQNLASQFSFSQILHKKFKDAKIGSFLKSKNISSDY